MLIKALTLIKCKKKYFFSLAAILKINIPIKAGGDTRSCTLSSTAASLSHIDQVVPINKHGIKPVASEAVWWDSPFLKMLLEQTRFSLPCSGLNVNIDTRVPLASFTESDYYWSKLVCLPGYISFKHLSRLLEVSSHFYWLYFFLIFSQISSYKFAQMLNLLFIELIEFIVVELIIIIFRFTPSTGWDKKRCVQALGEADVLGLDSYRLVDHTRGQEQLGVWTHGGVCVLFWL